MLTVEVVVRWTAFLEHPLGCVRLVGQGLDAKGAAASHFHDALAHRKSFSFLVYSNVRKELLLCFSCGARNIP